MIRCWQDEFWCVGVFETPNEAVMLIDSTLAYALSHRPTPRETFNERSDVESGLFSEAFLEPHHLFFARSVPLYTFWGAAQFQHMRFRQKGQGLDFFGSFSNFKQDCLELGGLCSLLSPAVG